MKKTPAFQTEVWGTDGQILGFKVCETVVIKDYGGNVLKVCHTLKDLMDGQTEFGKRPYRTQAENIQGNLMQDPIYGVAIV